MILLLQTVSDTYISKKLSYDDMCLFLDGNFVTLNSTQYGGQRIAFYSNGQVMPFNEVPPDVPNQPNTPASLIPVVHHYVCKLNR